MRLDDKYLSPERAFLTRLVHQLASSSTRAIELIESLAPASPPDEEAQPTTAIAATRFFDWLAEAADSHVLQFHEGSATTHIEIDGKCWVLTATSLSALGARRRLRLELHPSS